MIGGTNDPATPIRWAEEMTAALGPNARMVTFTGEGHGQLLASTCVTEIEAALLADLDAARRRHRVRPRPGGRAARLVGQPPTSRRVQRRGGAARREAPRWASPTRSGYGETRTTALGAQEATDAFEPSAHRRRLPDDLGNQDLGIDDTSRPATSRPTATCWW